jgi:NAD(P)-dependent dehydrogenase (short-subunit alcohol dehydrogenase family)
VRTYQVEAADDRPQVGPVDWHRVAVFACRPARSRAYTTKAGIAGLTRALAVGGRHSVNVNAIAPGVFEPN